MEAPAFTAIVLAGDRRPDEPLAQAAQVPCKVLAPVQGTPLVLRTVQTMAACPEIDHIVLVGPHWDHVLHSEALAKAINSDDVTWQEPQKSPSSSVQAAALNVAAHKPIVIATADHGLLESHMVSDFCMQVQQSNFDVVVAFVAYDKIRSRFPTIKKTVLKFSDKNYCGANLFAFRNVPGRTAADYWIEVEEKRKNPAQVIRFLGWGAVLRYLLRRLTLKDALQLLSKKMGVRVGAVVLPYPEAAIDIDSVEDWELVKAIVSSAPNRA